ncbi:Putative RNA methyltransferase pc1998 [Glycine soja]|uniref:Putative RNA methyltransferase pc1998 n=1 Tax=Glycine soja TaxID=3848 RepID=A0A0B2QWD6_GLYSO|nr:Putative RNA methyltransferase pc1998 [Glycine soja]
MTLRLVQLRRRSLSSPAHHRIHRPPPTDADANLFNSTVPTANLRTSLSSLPVWGWRCRAKLAVRGSSTEPLIGLYEEGTHNVVDIPQCQADHPNIKAAVELLRRGVEPFIEDEGAGDLHVQIIFGDKWKHLLGERDFWEHVGGIDVSLAPSSFGQANTLRLMPCFVILQAFDALLRKLQKYVPYESAVADLYAGAGVIGLSLATTRKCRQCLDDSKP